MTAPRMMTKNTLNAAKGWPSQSALDFVATLSAGITTRLPVLAGTVVTLNSSSGKFDLGCGNAKGMPMFLFNNSDDPDVANDGGDASTLAGVYIGITPSGGMMALVATGAYELVSTFYTTGSTYAPNDHLYAVKSNSSAAGGRLDVGTLWTNTIVGVVSRGVIDNGYGANALAFWPVYIPANPLS